MKAKITILLVNDAKLAAERRCVVVCLMKLRENSRTVLLLGGWRDCETCGGGPDSDTFRKQQLCRFNNTIFHRKHHSIIAVASLGRTILFDCGTRGSCVKTSRLTARLFIRASQQVLGRMMTSLLRLRMTRSIRRVAKCCVHAIAGSHSQKIAAVNFTIMWDLVAGCRGLMNLLERQ